MRYIIRITSEPPEPHPEWPDDERPRPDIGRGYGPMSWSRAQQFMRQHAGKGAFEIVRVCDPAYAPDETPAT